MRSGNRETAIAALLGAARFDDVLAGRIELFSAGTPALLPHIKSGALRCIGVGSPKRISALPDVPAIAETYPDFETEQWYGIHAKAGTPREIVLRLQQEVAKASARARRGGEARSGERHGGRGDAGGVWGVCGEGAGAVEGCGG